MEKLRVFTVCSGYDAQCLALDRLKRDYPKFDYELVGWSEIDKHAIAAHNALYPQYDGRNFGDLTKIDWNKVPDFDLLTYSTPCQSFSNAGRQEGGEEGSGTRSSILWYCRNAIIAKKPKYLVMENVAALVQAKFIKLFNKWQRELESYGYKNFSQLLNARDYNVPQNRLRIFIVSILDENARYEFPKPIPLTKKLKDVLEDNVNERYYLSDKALNGFIEHNKKNEEKKRGFKFEPKSEGSETANTITTIEGGRPTCTFLKIKQNDDDKEPKIISRPHGYFKGSESEISPCVKSSAFAANNFVNQPVIGALRGRAYGKWYESEHEQRLETRADGVTNTITGVNKDNVLVEKVVLGWTLSSSGKGEVVNRHPVSVANCVTAAKRDNTQNYDKELLNICDDDTAKTLTAGYYKYGAATLTSLTYGTTGTAVKESDNQNKFKIRKLTEREAFRLMDMDDADIDKIQDAGISRTQQYKMAGNSICVNVLYHIFRKMFIDTEPEESQLTLF